MNTLKFRKIKYLLQLIFGVILYMLLTSAVLQEELYNPLYHQAAILLKKTFNPWENSLPGDFDTCNEIVSVLLENSVDEGQHAAKVFTWKTPNFFNLFKRVALQTNTSLEYCLRLQLCSKYRVKKSSRTNKYNTQQLFMNNNKSLLFSTSESTFLVQTPKPKIGDKIRLQITVRNLEGERTASGGGDFFKIRAENPVTHSSVAASRISYLGDGIYDVEIKTFWTGRHDIKVFFAHPGHFIDVVKRLTSKRFAYKLTLEGEFQKSDHANFFPFSALSERTTCNINKQYLNPNKDICDYSRSQKESWFCEKPSYPLECNDLDSVYTSRRKNSLELFHVFSLHERGTINRRVLTGRPSTLIVSEHQVGVEKSDDNLPKCKAGMKTPSPAGYWSNGVWISTVCDNFPFSKYPLRKAECLRDRTFYFIGDSTSRQWYEYFLKTPTMQCKFSKYFCNYLFLTKEILPFINDWEPRSAVLKEFNTVFHSRSHGPPLQNGGPYKATRFVSFQLDEIPALNDKGSHLTVVIALGPHFLLFNPDVFLERISAVREAAIRLIARNPEATVIFKGSSTFIRGINIGECCLSDWLSFRHHKLAKSIFDGTSVIYLDVWDMTVSHESEDLIHPVREVVENEIDMALSYSCS